MTIDCVISPKLGVLQSEIHDSVLWRESPPGFICQIPVRALAPMEDRDVGMCAERSSQNTPPRGPLTSPVVVTFLIGHAYSQTWGGHTKA